MKLPNKIIAFIGGFFLTAANAGHAQTSMSTTPTPITEVTSTLEGCPSSTINALFGDFGRTGKMPKDLELWLNNPQSQITEPYQAFDNVYNVGICWLSAWLIKTSDGLVLIDTLYKPYTNQLIQNIKKLGFNPADIKIVLVTHGHFDHAGGVTSIKSLTNAKIVMTQKGWNEALINAQNSQGKPAAWTMPKSADLIVKDGDVLTLGGEKLYVCETPGHTEGTTSYALDVKDGDKTYRALVIGGLGLNAINGHQQVEVYINSIDRLKALVTDAKNPISVNLATHPFSSGLTEKKELLKTRKPSQPNPLVDSQALIKQLDELRAGAVERLAVEKSKISKNLK